MTDRSRQAQSATRDADIAARRARAAREPLDYRFDTHAPFPSVTVRNPAKSTRYRVVFPEYPERTGALCTCDDFSHRGIGSCKHIEGAWVALTARPPSPVIAVPEAWLKDVWNEVDQAFVSASNSGRLGGPLGMRFASEVMTAASNPFAESSIGAMGATHPTRVSKRRKRRSPTGET